MKKIIIAISTIGFLALAIKAVDIILRYTNEDYRTEKQIETWNYRLAKIEKEELCELADAKCQLKLNIQGDTLKFEMKNIKEEEKGYDVEFLYPKFKNKNTRIRQLNKEIELMVFDSLSTPEMYFTKFNNKYIEEFRSIEENEKYNWRDLEEIELIINSNSIISIIHHDFELKSGGAIWFGERIGFNYDLKNGNKITFEELIDQSKLDVLQKELTDAYKKQFEIELLKDNGWDEELIPISDNFILDKKGICFMYQRFEYSGVGGSGIDIEIPYCRLINLLKDESSVKEQLK